MVWLYCSPISVGRRGIIFLFKWFQPAFSRVEEGGVGGRQAVSQILRWQNNVDLFYDRSTLFTAASHLTEKGSGSGSIPLTNGSGSNSVTVQIMPPPFSCLAKCWIRIRIETNVVPKHWPHPSSLGKMAISWCSSLF